MAAPRNLIPNVLARIRAEVSKPWYRKPWAYWPRPWQTGFLALLALGVSGGIYASNILWGSISGSLQAQEIPGAALATPMLDVIGTLFNAIVLLARTVQPFWAAVIAGVCLILYLTSIGAGVACYRLATPPRS
jgi:hypothetical protein